MKEKLKGVLANRQKQLITDASRVPAAVLIPIYFKDNQYHILFTKRTERVSTHKGQISFPGGAYQDSDLTLVTTALRESTEEIGLSAKDVEVVGELDDTFSIASNYLISPFVGFIPWPYQFNLCQAETERLIEVPVPVLLQNRPLREETRPLNGIQVTSYFFPYNGDVIWGATARILNQLLDVVSII